MRTREIGIRSALGASKADVVRLVLWSGLAPVLLGLVVGTAAAGVSGRAISGLLFGVSPPIPGSETDVRAVFERAITLETLAAIEHEYLPGVAYRKA